MDNSNMSKHRPNDYLGVNKMGKSIKKSPLHQPNFVNNVASNINNPARQQPQPQVYNISKNDFRSIVQQLTGSPARQDPLPRPPSNPPKPPSMRLQRIRPPPLMPINRPPAPPVVTGPVPVQPHPQGPPMAAPPPVAFNSFSNNQNFSRPASQFGHPSPRGMQPGPGEWPSPALSPISAYMRQLQYCLADGSPRPSQLLPQPQVPGQGQAVQPQMPRVPGQVQAQPPMQGQMQAHPPAQQQAHGQVQPQPPSSGLLPNPNVPPLPSPRMSGLGILPSPTSDFLLPSPSSFFNLLSPTSRSPYPLLSPGSQFPPPLSPNFAFTPVGQSGILGPGPQPPLSPGFVFPPSSSGFFPVSSPRWRDQ